MITVAYNDVLYRAAELAGRTRDKLPASEAVMMQGYLAVDLQGVWNKATWPELLPDPVNVTPVARQFSKNEGQGSAPGATLTINVDYADPNLFFTVTSATPHGFSTGAMVTISSATLNPSVFNGTFPITVTDATHFTCPTVNQGSAFGQNGITLQRYQEMGDILGVWSADPTKTTKYRDVYFEEKDGAVRIYEDLASAFAAYLLPRPDLMSVAAAALPTYPVPARFSNYLALRAAGQLLNSDGMTNAGTTYLKLAEVALSNELTRFGAPVWARSPGVRSGVARTAQ